VSLRFFSKSWLFFMLKEGGNDGNWFRISVNSLDNPYAGQLRQFTIGRLSW